MPYKTIEVNSTRAVYERSVKKSQFYKGFSSLDDTTTNNKLYDLELVKQDIINHFNTKKGERLMNPNFGCIIWDLLMEPLTDQAKIDLENDITRIANSDPRVTPTQINLIEYPNGYLLELTLNLVETDQTDTLKLSFDQTVGLIVQ